MIKGQISIIMSVFNCEKTLRQSIDSILAQTYTNWQFIICDDCSKDGTMDILEEYSNKYPDKFIIIQNEKNMRLPASLNHCLQYAQGEFCARMDGDDYVAPERFEKQVQYLQDNQEVHLVGTLMKAFGEEGFGRVIPYNEFPDKYELRYGPCFSHASILTYTKVYQDLGGYTVSPRTVRGQDYDLWFKFFAKGFKGVNLQEPLYYVREDEYSFLRRKPKLYLWAMVTRWKGFRTLKFPARYYIYVLAPILALFRNEVRKVKARIELKKKRIINVEYYNKRG